MFVTMKYYFATHFQLSSCIRFASGAGFLGTGHVDDAQYLQIWCFIAFLWDYVKYAVYGYVGQLTILKVLNRGLVQLWNQELQ